MMNRSNSERLEVIIQKLDKIIDLMTPKETKIQVVTATDAPNGFSIDSDGSVEINAVEATVQTTPFDNKVLLGKHSRKRMIKAAQDAHRILASNVYSSPDGTTFMYGVIKNGRHKYMCTADFIVSKEKRKVICLMKEKDTNKVLSRGISKCDPADVFNIDIGMAIALYRALGLNVPSNYFEIANPTEYETGQIVELPKGSRYKLTKIDGNYFDMYSFQTEKLYARCYYSNLKAKIIEDGVEV